jgi:hypothetical protein
VCGLGRQPGAFVAPALVLLSWSSGRLRGFCVQASDGREHPALRRAHGRAHLRWPSHWMKGVQLLALFGVLTSVLLVPTSSRPRKRVVLAWSGVAASHGPGAACREAAGGLTSASASCAPDRRASRASR